MAYPYSPFARWIKSGAGIAIPGTVRVSGQAAVRTGGPVDVATVQRNLGDAFIGAHVQLLLFEKQGRRLFVCLFSQLLELQEDV